MRETKFRGKRVDNDEWVYGFYVKSFRSSNESPKHWILCSAGHNGGALLLYGRYQVNPSTIGQFTGLYDKNGKGIYEGDYIIVNGETPLYTEHTTIKSQEVFFENGAFWCAWSDGIDTYGGDTLLADVQTKNIEVIGNIHDKGVL